MCRTVGRRPPRGDAANASPARGLTAPTSRRLRAHGGSRKNTVAHPLRFQGRSRDSRTNAWSHFAHTSCASRGCAGGREHDDATHHPIASVREQRRRPGPSRVRAARRADRARLRRRHRSGWLERQCDLRQDRHRARALVVERSAVKRGGKEMAGWMMLVIDRIRREEEQNLLEYALLIALIALVCVGTIGLAGSNVNVIFGKIATALTPSS